ncbi:MAG: hypothetical protein V7K35_02325 [Nostoc sp.]|uniref:hypothetical protein n=1 Tax=Nostoc sp. TaxID=1180 RepID=UPI002FF8641F
MATILLWERLTLPVFLLSRFPCLQPTLSFTTLLYYALPGLCIMLIAKNFLANRLKGAIAAKSDRHISN